MTADAASIEQGDLAEVGQRLRAARAKIGMTRKQLAAASDTSERYLANLEGGTGNPSLSVLSALADALDTAVADLLPAGGERSKLQAGLAAKMRRLPAARLDALRQWIERPDLPNDQKARRIVLVGLRGAGKSSLGAGLASQTGMPFFEVSKEVEAAYGAEIGLLIELGGQAALRRYEAEAWDAICATNDAAVIAVPGGIVANGPLYDHVLATAHSIWLQATPDDHMKRVMAQGDFRPMASNRGAMADLKAILNARSADYARAEATLDTSAQGYEETLAMLTSIARASID